MPLTVPLVTSDRTVVVGIGNSLMCDDGVGIQVIRHLQAKPGRQSLPKGRIDIIDGGTLGYLLLERLEGVEGLLVVDAANLRREPGAVGVFENEAMDAYLTGNPKSSVHEVGLVDLLQMLAMLEETPRRRALIGVQPAVVDWGTELSPAVASSVETAADAALKLVSEWYGRKSS